jgi:hypothetical protein
MLIPLLLAVLAAPACAAVRPASCLHVSSGTATSSLDELRDCQEKTRAAVVAAAEKKGAPLTEAQLDKLDDYQRDEARKFLSQPQIVSTGNADGAAPKPAARPRKRRKRAAASDGNAGGTPPTTDGATSPNEGTDLLNGVPSGGLPPETVEKLKGLHLDIPVEKPAGAPSPSPDL